MSDLPQDPITDMAMMMTALHESYSSAVAAGFSEDQAMAIVLGMISAGLGHS